jgi:hypothetical protein
MTRGSHFWMSRRNVHVWVEWILKERAGYGSHGNQLESTKGSSASYWCSWVLAGDRMGIDANRVVNVDVAPCFFERIL